MPATNALGLAIIKGDEGDVLYCYDDATGKRLMPGDHCVGTPTIGRGHTGADVHPGQTITLAESDSIFVHDLHPFEIAVNNMVDENINTNQFSALVSLAYNLGSAALQQSSIIRNLNDGRIQAAADSFLLYDKGVRGDGTFGVIEGLAKRRQQERELFLKAA